MNERTIGQLSPRQRDAFQFMEAYQAANGFLPSYREIADALGIASTNGVSDHVKALVRKGFIKKAPGNKARGMQLTSKGRVHRRSEVISVPYEDGVGREHVLYLDRRLLPPGDVRAYSMPENNVTTFALLREGSPKTLKSFWRRPDGQFAEGKIVAEGNVYLGEVVAVWQRH